MRWRGPCFSCEGVRRRWCLRTLYLLEARCYAPLFSLVPSCWGGWYLLADTRFEDYMGWALLIPGMSAACIAFLLFD